MELTALTPSPEPLELSEVQRGADGLPTAWPLLRAGDNFLTLNGVPHRLTLDGADLDRIVTYHREKGCKIPLDSRHVVSNLAGKLGIDPSQGAGHAGRSVPFAGVGHRRAREFRHKKSATERLRFF